MREDELDPLEPRIPCECCGCLTRVVPLDPHGSRYLFEEVSPSCPLCEWESPPLDASGEVIVGSATAEERNSGYSLPEARAALRT